MNEYSQPHSDSKPLVSYLKIYNVIIVQVHVCMYIIATNQMTINICIKYNVNHLPIPHSYIQNCTGVNIEKFWKEQSKYFCSPEEALS